MAKRQYIEAKSGLTLTYGGDPYPIPAGKTPVTEAFRIREGSPGAGEIHPDSARMCALTVEKFGAVQMDGGRVALVRTYAEHEEAPPDTEPAAVEADVASGTPAPVALTEPTSTEPVPTLVDVVMEQLAEGVAPEPIPGPPPIEVEGD